MSFAFTSNSFWTDPIMDSKLTAKLDRNVEERMLSSKTKPVFFQKYYNFEIYLKIFHTELWQYVYKPTRCTKFLWLDFIIY